MLKEILDMFSQLNPTVQVIILIGVYHLINTGRIVVPTWFKKEKGTTETGDSCLHKMKQERSKGERITIIKYFDTVYEQMSVVRTTASTISDLLTDVFVEVLNTKDVTEEQHNDALQIYQMLIDGALDNASGYLRRWVKRNGLTDMNDVEYQTYIHNRIEESQKLIKKYIDRTFLKNQLHMDRGELHEVNLILFHERVKDIMADMFIKLRSIAELNYQKIAEIEAE